MVSTCGEINRPVGAEAPTFRPQRKRRSSASKTPQTRSLNELCKVTQLTWKEQSGIVWSFSEVFPYGSNPSTGGALHVRLKQEPQRLKGLLEDRGRVEGGGALYLRVRCSLAFANDHWS